MEINDFIKKKYRMSISMIRDGKTIIQSEAE